MKYATWVPMRYLLCCIILYTALPKCLQRWLPWLCAGSQGCEFYCNEMTQNVIVQAHGSTLRMLMEPCCYQTQCKPQRLSHCGCTRSVARLSFHKGGCTAQQQ